MRGFVAVVVVALVVVGCDRQQPAAPATTSANTTAPVPVEVTPPDQIVVAYYAAMNEKRYDDAYSMVNEADRNARPLATFKASASDPLQEAIAQHRTYEIADVTIDGDKALVLVDSTGPDIASLQKFVVAKHLSKNPEMPDAEGLKALMRDALEMPELPTIITHQKVFLVKGTSGDWMLDFDWDKEHMSRGVPLQERPKKAKPDAGDDSAAGDQ